MTQHSQPENTSMPISAEMVVEYLQQFPDFFIQQEELLLALRLPHESGKAISLIEYQLNRLRNRNQELQKQLNLLLDTARENDRLFEKTRRLILQLLEADSLENLIATVEDNLRHDFKIEAVSFILFNQQPHNMAGRTLPLEEAQEKLGNLLNVNTISTGQFRDTVTQFLFGNNTNVKSIAFMPLNQTQALGLLALGSTNPNRYQRDTGTLFLQQLGDILCKLLPRFLS